MFEHALASRLPDSTTTPPMAWGAVRPYPGPVESLAGSEVPELTEFDVAEREAHATPLNGPVWEKRS